MAVPFVWGHHVAFGGPLLGPETRLDLPPGIVRTLAGDDKPCRRFKGDQRSADPQLVHKDGSVVDLTIAAQPESGTVDNFEIELRDAGFAAVRNPLLDLGVALIWDREELPFLWEWELCHAATGYPFWGRDYFFWSLSIARSVVSRTRPPGSDFAGSVLEKPGILIWFAVGLAGGFLSGTCCKTRTASHSSYGVNGCQVRRPRGARALWCA